MPAPIPASPPEDAWSGERVTRWLRQAAHLQRQMAPVSEQLFAAAAIQDGESVLDVGCGTGSTTREAAVLAGAAGHVTGLDVSPEMLAAAGDAEVVDGSASLEWVQADGSTWEPPSGRYDAVISRFGVMFFADPPAAVANLATATRPGGRLAVAVWGERTESPMFELPYQIALDVRHAHGDDIAPLPTDEGPFAWHDAASVTAPLESAGWHGVEIARHALHLPFGGGVTPAVAASAAVDFGPSRLIMQGADPSRIQALQDALTVAFADHVDADGHVVLDAAVRIVTAGR